MNYKIEKLKYVFIIFILSSFLASCTSQENKLLETSEVEVTEVSNHQLVFIIETNGGCIRMGPNCPRYELYSDGEFNVYRSNATEAANNGIIDSELVNSWIELAKATDFNALKSRLSKGECKACYDGVDVLYAILPESKKIVLNSREYEFSSEEIFFQVSQKLIDSMRQTAPLELIGRD